MKKTHGLLKLRVMTAALGIAVVTSSFTMLPKGETVKAKDITNGTYQSKRLSGGNRYSTALAIANEYAAGSIDNVVIATGNDFPDALAGSVLAAKLNAPILLVGGGNSDTTNVVNYIKNHLKKDGHVYILGGVGVVPNSVIDILRSNGYNNIARLGGANREETAELIDITINVPVGTPIVITTENDFPDALSVSSVAGAKGYPIVLSSKNGLPQISKELVKRINPSKVYIIGGTGVLSSNIENDIKSIISIDNSSITRISGANRYETSLNIAKTFNLDTTNSAIATGNDFPDALAGSVLAAKLNAPILLIDNDDVAAQKSYLDSSKINNLIMLGGNGAVSTTAEGRLTASVQVTQPSQPAQPSVGMQTPTGIVSSKIVYTDSEISDNPTLNQMMALPNVITVTPESNPELFIQISGADQKTLNWSILNLTNKIYHAKYIYHGNGIPDQTIDQFVKVLSEKIGSDNTPVINKTVTIVTFVNGIPDVNRSFVGEDVNREQYNYLKNEK